MGYANDALFFHASASRVANERNPVALWIAPILGLALVATAVQKVNAAWYNGEAEGCGCDLA